LLVFSLLFCVITYYILGAYSDIVACHCSTAKTFCSSCEVKVKVVIFEAAWHDGTYRTD